MLPAIEHLKSGLSINTNSGCILGCKYCILSSIDEKNNKIQVICEPSELYYQLKNNKYYVENSTPLFINNRTDPFHIGVINNTIEILSILAKEKIKNCILLISKLPPPDRLKEFFFELNLIYIYTYTNMPRGIDYNSNNGVYIKDVEKIEKYVPYNSRIHSFRPIIPRLNDNAEDIMKFINEANNVFSKHIIAGVRIVDNNINIIEEITGLKFNYINPSKKFLENNFEFEIQDMFAVEKKLIRHTACAIASFLKEPIKLYDYFGRSSHCNCNCENYSICKRGYVDIKKDDVNIQIIKMTKSRFSWKSNILVFHDPVEQESIASIKNAYGVKVIAENVIPSYSERILMNE